MIKLCLYNNNIYLIIFFIQIIHTLYTFNIIYNLTKYRLDEINNIKEYFNTEIKERKDIIKKISNILVF